MQLLQVKMNYYNDFVENISKDDEVICILSGLNFGLDTNNGIYQRQLLINFFSGVINFELQRLSSFIKKLFICGSSICPHHKNDLVDRMSYFKNDINNEVHNYLKKNLNDLDKFLETLSKQIPIFLLPGEDDLTQAVFPQEAFKSFLLSSSKLETLKLCDNPFYSNINNFSLLFTSGQNISSIKKYSSLNFGDCVLKSLQSSHISPCCPDMLRSYPFKTEDPLVLNDLPDYYFASSSEFNYSQIESHNSKIKVLGIPDFSLKGQIVIVNLTKETNLVIEMK